MSVSGAPVLASAPTGLRTASAYTGTCAPMITHRSAGSPK